MAKKRIVGAIGHKDMGTNLRNRRRRLSGQPGPLRTLSRMAGRQPLCTANAPQVGMIHTAMNEFGRQHDGYSMAPMSVCSAMSQGYIGYDLQNGIRAELIRRGIYKPVSTVLTQVTVDPYDEAFYTPVKVIGRVMTEEEAGRRRPRATTSPLWRADTAGLWLLPVPLPSWRLTPSRRSWTRTRLSIACGGGGIPVMEQGCFLRGASAIIEKDLAAGLLAKEIDADVMMILTSVDNVTLNYGTPSEQPIHHMDIAPGQGIH